VTAAFGAGVGDSATSGPPLRKRRTSSTKRVHAGSVSSRMWFLP
jgi:hypothetical protein